MGKEDYENSGLPSRHKWFRPNEHNQHEQWRNVYEKVKNIIHTGATVAVVGNRGSGKTQLGAALIGYMALEKDRSVMYRKAFEIFLRIREAIKVPGDSEVKAVESFIKRYFMVIDAYEVRGDTPFENRMLDHIIDKRYDAKHPTMIISNDTPMGITESLGPSIMDRIRETGGIIEMSWSSFRGEK